MSVVVQEIRQDLEPKEDLSPYAGQWVALRGGRVVATALDAVSLKQDPEVRDDDVLMPVPPPGNGFFVA